MGVAKTISYNVIAKMLNHLLVFGINIFITRILGAAYSGSFFNDLYILSFIAFVASFGLNYSLVFFINKHQYSYNSLTKKSIILSVVFIGFTLLYFVSSKGISSVNYTYAAFIIGIYISTIFQAYGVALTEFKQQNTLLLVTNSAILLLLLLLYALQLKNVLSNRVVLVITPICYGISFLMQGLLFYIAAIKKTTNPKAFLGKAVPWSTFLKQGLPMLFSSLVFYVYLRVDNFFVEKYTNAEVLSNYIQCGKIGQYFMYLPTIVSGVLFPLWLRNKIEFSFKFWAKTVFPYFLLLVFTALILESFGSKIYPFLFGNDFEFMNEYMQILLPGFIALGLLTLVNSVYFAKNNLKTITITDSIGLVCIILGDLIWVPKYGAVGAAYVSSISYMVTLLLLLIPLRKQFK